MRKQILIPRKGFVLLFVSILLSHYVLFAQPTQLKNQAYDVGSVNHVTGNNNLRRLSRIYDQQSNAPKPPGDDAQLRRLYELDLLKDPATGELPEGIREKELLFAQHITSQLKNGRVNARITENWKARGPSNVGGRTRAVAIDVDNENIILAAGVSGGMWRSVDNGMSWHKTTGSNEIQSATAIVQDPRVGFHNVWYYSTGERLGNSASGSGAFFSGNGIYKSVDGGITWAKLTSIADNLPQTISPYDLIFNLAIHPTTGDLYVATWWGIHWSTNGGATFAEVLPGDRDNWTDVIITPNGILYATIDSGGLPNKGILRSANGTTWTNITPTGFPATGTTLWGRAVMAYTPTNENVIYVYADNGLNDGGAFLWRYTDSATTPVWSNLTANLPALGGTVGNLNTQGGYNMVVKVHPSDPAIVFIGATNLYRSSNGFTSTVGTKWIGGYSPANNVSIYPDQHPDQHALVFYPSDPTKAISGNDGGVQVTTNILASNAGTFPVQWTSINNGYLTTQPYALSFNTQGTGDQLMAGFQDNGSWFTNSADATVHWTEEFTGDGSYNAFADNGLSRYVSSQSGNIYRLNYLNANDPADDYVSFTRIKPTGATGFAFITPFVLDPNDDNIMYLPVGSRIWRNDNLDGIPLFSNATATVNWNNLANTQVPTGNTITAVAISRLPANKLYFGTSRGLIYKVDNANIGDQPKVDIATGKGLPVGNISCITIDPANANRVFVVFSNYNTLSIFLTENGGTTWTSISGNLEETATGLGSGPSVRWLAVEGNSDRYYVGTSIGLYATSTLAGFSTVWSQEDAGGIGNIVVPMVCTREDGFVALAAHGNGLYSAKFEVTALPQPKLKIVNAIADFEVFVNSPTTIINIGDVFKDADGNTITYSLINTNPALVTATLNGVLLTLAYTPGAKGKSTLGLIATAGSESLSEVFTVTVRDLEPVLYNQNTANYNSRPSQMFTDFGNVLAQSADDFEIPSPQTWSIEKVIVPGGVNGSPLLQAARVLIYSDNAGKPGDEVYHSTVIVPASGAANPTLELILPTVATLSAGKYWLSVYVELPYGSGNQWFWQTTTTLTGAEAHFKDADDLFGTGAVDWTPMSVSFAGPSLDLLFKFFGKATGSPTPSKPTNLDALTLSPTKFNLTWLDNSSNELGFLLERSTNGTVFSKRTTVGPNTTNYADTDLFDPLLTYYYRVAAIGLSDTSAYSNIDATAVIAVAPIAKLASYIFPTSFTANWEASPGATYYRLDVSPDNFVTYLKGYEGVKVNGTKLLVKGTRYGKQYKYRVRAVNAGGESANSNVITVASIRSLSLASVCSDNPALTRRWLITNPNPFTIEVEWFIYKTDQKEKIIAAPGKTYFTTNTVAGFNTAIILWHDDFQLPRLAAKISCAVQCTAASSSVAEARATYDGAGIETESPFIVNAWPNPSTDKFHILVASPFEDDVELEIYSIRGERLFMSKARANTVVDVDAEHYATGIFILKAKQAMYNQTIKLVKK